MRTDRLRQLENGPIAPLFTKGLFCDFRQFLAIADGRDQQRLKSQFAVGLSPPIEKANSRPARPCIAPKSGFLGIYHD